MRTGKIKWFDTKKGYGFIIADDGKEYFLHYTGVANHNDEDYVRFNNGDEVEFNIMNGAKGEQACDVVVTKAAPPQKKKFNKKRANNDNANN